MDSENTPYVLTTLSSFLSETRWVTSVSDWQLCWFDLLFHVHCGNGLLRSCDKVAWLLIKLFLLGIIFSRSLHFVQILLKIWKLASSVHYWRFHEVWWLQWRVSVLVKQVETIVNKGLIEENTNSFEIVTSMSGNFRASLEFNHVKALHYLVVM